MYGLVHSPHWRATRFISAVPSPELVAIEFDDYFTAITFTPSRARQLADSLLREADRAEAVSPNIGTAA